MNTSDVEVKQEVTCDDLAVESIKAIEYFIDNLSIEKIEKAKENMMKSIENEEIKDYNALMNYFNKFWKLCFEAYEKINNVCIN